MKRLLFSVIFFAAGAAHANLQCPAGTHPSVFCRVNGESLALAVCEANGQALMISSKNLSGLVVNRRTQGWMEILTINTSGAGQIEIGTGAVEPGKRSGDTASEVKLAGIKKAAVCRVDKTGRSTLPDIFPGQSGDGCPTGSRSPACGQAGRFPGQR